MAQAHEATLAEAAVDARADEQVVAEPRVGEVDLVTRAGEQPQEGRAVRVHLRVQTLLVFPEQLVVEQLLATRHAELDERAQRGLQRHLGLDLTFEQPPRLVMRDVPVAAHRHAVPPLALGRPEVAVHTSHGLCEIDLRHEAHVGAETR